MKRTINQLVSSPRLCWAFSTSRIAAIFRAPPNTHANFRNLDGLRFISSCAVVLLHYNSYANQLFANSASFTENFTYFVDVFFVISGIIISLSYAKAISSSKEYARFILLRIARLYPLHAVTLLFYVILGLLSLFDYIKVVNPAKYNFNDLLPNLFLTHAWGAKSELSFNYVSWSVSAEFFCYLLFPFLLIPFKRSKLYGVFSLFVIFCLTHYVASLFLGDRAAIPNSDLPPLQKAVNGFCVGVFTYFNREKLASLFSSKTIQIVANGLLLALVCAMLSGLGRAATLLLVYLTVIFHCLGDEKKVPLLTSCRFISGYAEITYTVYMLHTLVATFVISWIFPLLFGKNPVSLLISLLIALPITFWCSCACYRLFELPARELIRRFTNRILS